MGITAPETGSVEVHYAGVPEVHRARFRSDGFGQSRNSMVLQPEEVVVQVPDDLASRQADGTWRSFLTYLGPPETTSGSHQVVPNGDLRPLRSAT